MRFVPIILLSLLLSVKCRSQSNQIDSLISVMNNSQLGIRMQYVWSPVLKSEAGDSLIKIGKPTTQKLIHILDDTTKGIIAHHILVTIWAEELREAGWDISSGFVDLHEKSKPQNIAEILIGGLENKVEYISEIKVNGLKVFMKKYDLYTDFQELLRNKNEWSHFISQKTFR